MKQLVADCLLSAVNQLKSNGVLADNFEPRIVVDNSKDKAHGDFASNLAMMLTKSIGKPPREVAQLIIDALPVSEMITKVDIAGPGFINFFVEESAKFAVIGKVLAEKENFGCSDFGQGKKVLVEFVSANPTGPLHVGHGRGAAYGASLANLLQVAGFEVSNEYYVNDAGRQMDILATSTWLRYLELHGQKINFPSNGYKGSYVADIAQAIVDEHGDIFVKSVDDVFAGVFADEVKNDVGETLSGDKEKHIDGLNVNAKNLLGEVNYRVVFDKALTVILADIKQDLTDFKVDFDEWFSERSLMDTGDIDAAIAKLQAANKIYEKNGALWFRSTDYGDEKDRVVVRDNGLKTYFASDIAYHLNKLGRGFDILIDVWGSDHHGYVPRVKAGMEAMGASSDALEVLLVQFAILYRSGEKLAMSTRSGQFVTLRELRDEVGTDAARFFYVQRKSEQHMDFDLDLAKSQSNDNPVYYIQYAHARICRVFEQAEQKGFKIDIFSQKLPPAHIAIQSPGDMPKGVGEFGSLEQETALAMLLAKYPEIVNRAAKAREPHQIAYYLKDLAQGLHSYYNVCQFIVDDDDLRNQRFALIQSVRQVLQNGLAIIGVSAPTSM